MADEHPFYSPEQDAWVDAIDLEPGMWLLSSEGTLAQVTHTTTWTQPATVHNLTIDDLSTYHVAVGETDSLVHNATPGCGPFTDGDIFLREFPAGDQTIEVMAGVRHSGTDLILDNAAMFARGTPGLTRAPIGVEGVMAVKSQVSNLARGQGFSRIVVNYIRFSANGGRRPGSMTIDL